MDKIISDIQKKQNIILIIPEEKYQNTLMMLLEQLEKEKKNICFVSANKTKDALEKELKENRYSKSNKKNNWRKAKTIAKSTANASKTSLRLKRAQRRRKILLGQKTCFSVY